MVICKIFISVTMEQSQLRHPLLCCPRNKLGTSWTLGNPYRVKSLANPKIASLIKMKSRRRENMSKEVRTARGVPTH